MPLYVVSKKVEAIVYAKDEFSAEDLADDAIREELDLVGPADVELLGHFLPMDWNEQCYVYQEDPSRPLTVAEARKLP